MNMKEEEYHVHSNTLTTMFLVCTRSYTVTSSLATTISPSLDDAQCPWSVPYLHKSKIKTKAARKRAVLFYVILVATTNEV